MGSTRACATLIGLPTSNTSHSPAQKSNCRYAGAAQEESFGDSAAAPRATVISFPRSRTTTAATPTFDHRTIEFIVFLGFLVLSSAHRLFLRTAHPNQDICALEPELDVCGPRYERTRAGIVRALARR